MTVGVVL